MRQGHKNQILFRKKGKIFVGVSLGADYCAEHEWGIDSIRKSFGVDKTKLGIEGKSVTQLPSGRHYQFLWLDKIRLENDKREWSGFYYSYVDNGKPAIRGYAGKDTLLTLWDGESFCAISSDAVEAENLKVLFSAFEKNNVAMWVGGGGIFENGGLCFALIDQLAEETKQAWLTADQEKVKLEKDVVSLGIREELKKAGCSYMALSPLRQENGSIKFWLNPTKQDQNNFGWYTVTELRQWIQGKGPIPKKK